MFTEVFIFLTLRSFYKNINFFTINNLLFEKNIFSTRKSISHVTNYLVTIYKI